jgi:hypothetical protein
MGSKEWPPVDEWLQRYCWCDQATHKCDPPLRFNLSRSPWLCWQLENCSFLTFAQTCQEHDLTIWKFQRIVMSGDFVFVDLPKDRRLMLDCTVVPWPHSS